ncbi:MAG: tetratricopeptide repeat protein [Ignavibacteriaceae bacterium]
MNVFRSLKLLNKKVVFFLIFFSLLLSSCSKSPKELRKDADKYYAQAVDYYERGYNSNAKNLFSEVLEIENDLKIVDRAGDIHLYLGLIAFDNSNFYSALDHYKKSIQIFKKKLNRKREGITENNIGNIYSSLGEYEKAIENYKRALSISEFSADKEGEAIAELNIGTVYYEQENFQQAFNYYNRSYKNYEIIFDIEGELNSQIKIGETYLKFGSLPEALKTFDEALETAEQMGLNYFIPSIMIRTGNAYYKLNNFQQALNAFNYGLEKIKDKNEKPVETWTLLNNIGDCFNKLFQTGKAIENYEEAIKLSDKFGEGLNSALIKLKVADIYLNENNAENSGQIKKTKKMFEELYEYFDGINFQPGIAQALTGIAECNFIEKDYDTALEKLNEIERIFAERSISLNNRLAENFCIIPDLFKVEKFLSVFLEQNKINELLELSLNFDNYSAISFLKGLNNFDFGDERDNRLFDSVKTNEDQINYLKFEISNEEGKLKGFKYSEKIDNLENLLEGKKARKNITSSLAILKKYFNINNNFSVEEIQKRLNNSQAFLAYFLNDTIIIASVISKEKIINKKILFSSEAFEGQINSLLKSISNNDSSSAKPLFKGIFNKLIEPIQDEISNKSKIIIYTSSSKGKINFLPFHALIDEQNKFLFETKNIKYFGGFSKNKNTLNDKSITVVSDSSYYLNNISSNFVNEIRVSLSAKEKLLKVNPQSLIIFSPIYFNIEQPSTSYFELSSDSVSAPSDNLNIGESVLLKTNNIFIFNYLTDKESSVKIFNNIFPSANSIMMSYFSIPQKIKSDFSSQIISQINESNTFDLNMIYKSSKEKKLFWSSLFQYIKL